MARRCGHQASGTAVLLHIHSQPLQASLILIGFNSRGLTCAHTVLHSTATVCHADVTGNHLGSAGAHILDFRGFSTPCYEPNRDHTHVERKGRSTVAWWPVDEAWKSTLAIFLMMVFVKQFVNQLSLKVTECDFQGGLKYQINSLVWNTSHSIFWQLSTLFQMFFCLN